MSLNFDIPQYYYFQAVNDYLGSRNGLNFKITCSDSLNIELYHGTKCYELSKPYLQETFEKSSKGYSSLLEWLESKYLEHQNTEFYSTRISLR